VAGVGERQLLYKIYKKAFARPRLFVVILGLCCSVEQAYGLVSPNLRFGFQLSSVKKIIVEPSGDCPQPLIVTTFLRKQICVHVCLGEKLAVAKALLEQQGFTRVSQLDVQRITGFRPGQVSLHGQGMAIDIDAATNPYIIHEHNESRLDEELAVVYERIAQFMLGRASIIPRLGTGGHSKEPRHTYVERFYNVLAQESAAMQRYFALMQDGPRLQVYVRTPPGSQRVRLPSTFLSILSRENSSSSQTRDNASSAVLSNLLIDQIRLRMMSDWMTLTGQEGPPILALASDAAGIAGKNGQLPYPQVVPLASGNPAKREIDRPFDAKDTSYPGRSPLNGFLTHRKELVLALIDAGLRWGALDFGRTSGDIMHFDSRDPTCNGSNDGN
jgi:hypothetical protein